MTEEINLREAPFQSREIRLTDVLFGADPSVADATLSARMDTLEEVILKVFQNPPGPTDLTSAQQIELRTLLAGPPYVGAMAYDNAAHTLSLTITDSPSLMILDTLFFLGPADLDRATDALTIMYGTLSYDLLDKDGLQVSADDLDPGRLYEAIILLSGGRQQKFYLQDPVVSQHGHFEKYLLFMGETVKDNLPVEADFLNTTISANTTNRFAQFADLSALNEQGRRWFACPFDDIEHVLIQPYSTVGDIRAAIGTPAIGGQTLSFAPYEIEINSKKFFAYGDFQATKNPQNFAGTNRYYDMQRY